MVTREVGDDLPADRAILRHIVRELDQNVGVYAKVTQPGAIKSNDQLTFL
jgi:MOSC domain-containing protein YiiM